MKGSAWGNWDPWEVQQLFRPNPNGVGDRTTTLRRLLIGAVTSSTDRKANFFLSVLASFKILFIVEDCNCYYSLCDSKVISVPVMRKYLIGSSLRTSFSSIIPILPLFSISPLAVAPLLTSSLFPTLLFLKRAYEFSLQSSPNATNCPSLCAFRPNNWPLTTIFRKLVGMTYPFALNLTTILQKNTLLFHLQLLSLLLWHRKWPKRPFPSIALNANPNSSGLMK